mmetsp:Transcript_16843/g.67956  ORF Transcript_16843/g.67956 Transcript_16843/m.67956 type:complete len:351 (-) Transcript_16843:522-1574(-)
MILRDSLPYFKHRSDEERESRFLVFVDNLEEVVSRNADLAEAGLDEVHGITKFADWTKDEFAAMVGGVKAPRAFAGLNATKVAVPRFTDSAPTSFDWRDSNVITPVKDQGHCGSCWAHSAVEAIESQMALAGMPLTSLSVQQVTSCDTSDSGCGGGWYDVSWTDYIEKAGGLTTEEAYPYDTATYDGHATKCDATKMADLVDGSNVDGYAWASAPCEGVMCKNQDEDSLKKNLLSYGPVSIACDASQWSSYTGGVMTSASCSNSDMKLDHAIQLVGYNEDADVPYWIVRNSWADTWGLDGYIYLKMGDNTCGIADHAAVPTLNTAAKAVEKKDTIVPRDLVDGPKNVATM